MGEGVEFPASTVDSEDSSLRLYRLMVAVLRLLSTARSEMGCMPHVPREIVLDLAAGTRKKIDLGRSKKCTVVVNPEGVPGGASNIISRRHVEILRDGQSGHSNIAQWSFRDLGAMNGTFLNDRKSSGSILKHGDTLQLGGGAGLSEGDILRDRDAGICYVFQIVERGALLVNCGQSGKRRVLDGGGERGGDSVSNAVPSSSKGKKLRLLSPADSPTDKTWFSSSSTTTSVQPSSGDAQAAPPFHMVPSPIQTAAKPRSGSTSSIVPPSNTSSEEARVCAAAPSTLLNPLYACNAASRTTLCAQAVAADGSGATRLEGGGCYRDVAVEQEGWLLPKISFRAAATIKKQLLCSVCSDILLDARLLPCSHAVCRACYVDRIEISSINSTNELSKTLINDDHKQRAFYRHHEDDTAGENGKSCSTFEKTASLASMKPMRETRVLCPVCRQPVPPSWVACGSMHLEDLIDIVVESLPLEEQSRINLRRRIVKERFTTSVALDDDDQVNQRTRNGRAKAREEAEQTPPSMTLSGEGTLLSLEGLLPRSRGGYSTSKYDDADASSGGRGGVGDGGGDCSGKGNESSNNIDELRCSGCNEIGHAENDCPHRNSSDEDCDAHSVNSGDEY